MHRVASELGSHHPLSVSLPTESQPHGKKQRMLETGMRSTGNQSNQQQNETVINIDTMQDDERADPVDLPSLPPSLGPFPRLESLIAHFRDEGKVVGPVQLFNELVASSKLSAKKAKAAGRFAVHLTLPNGQMWKESISGSEALAASHILEEIFAELESIEPMAQSVAVLGQRPAAAQEAKPLALQPSTVAPMDDEISKVQLALEKGKSPVSLLNEICAKSNFGLSWQEEGAGTSFICRGTVIDLSTGNTAASTTDLSARPSVSKKQAKGQASTELIDIILSQRQVEAKEVEDQEKNSILLRMQKANEVKEKELTERLKSLDMRMVFLSGVQGEDEEGQWGIPQLKATHGGGGVKVLSKIEGIEKGGVLGPVLAEAETVQAARHLAIKMCEFVLFHALDQIVQNLELRS